MASGFHSLPPVPIGISVPPPASGCRSILAFWMGGGCAPFVPVPPIPPQPVPVPEEGGLPWAKHLLPRRIRDDEEILEFIRIWTCFESVE